MITDGFPLSSRRELLRAVPAFVALAAAPRLFAAPAAPKLSFLVLGDWGRDGRYRQAEVAGQMGLAAERLGSRFVATTGDNFYVDGVSSRFDSQWRTSFENIYTAPSLQTPWFPTLGNHDYYGDPDAQLEYALYNPRWRFPRRWYSVAGADFGQPQIDLFFIDSESIFWRSYPRHAPARAHKVRYEEAQQQLDWLSQALPASTARWKLVFGHHPIFSARGDKPVMIANLLPVLAAGRATAYVHGHDHCLQHIRRGGLHHICSGAGSQISSLDHCTGISFAASTSGFAAITVEADSLSLRFIDYLGCELYSSRIDEASALETSGDLLLVDKKRLCLRPDFTCLRSAPGARPRL